MSVPQGGIEVHREKMTCLGLWRRGGELCTASLVPALIPRKLFRGGRSTFHRSTDTGPSCVNRSDCGAGSVWREQSQSLE